MPDHANPKAYETSNRTYPSAGGAYDLEIYPVVRECDGIAAGMYHYQPTEHALSALRAREAYLQRLLRRAYTANGAQVVPQVPLVIASRFGRLSWKYRGIAYANTLRDVGVLYEAMYLAATAMGLAPCALGTGDSGAFGAATHLDPLAESSVGEFMLGTLPAGDIQNGAVAAHAASGIAEQAVTCQQSPPPVRDKRGFSQLTNSEHRLPGPFSFLSNWAGSWSTTPSPSTESWSRWRRPCAKARSSPSSRAPSG